jgi:predicted porin
MKKTLVAIAALASVSAFAQTTVTIAGDLDFGIRSVNAPGSYADTSGLFHDGAATTAIFFRVTEDLGGGLSANFQYEMNPDLVAGSGVSGVGLGQTSSNTSTGYQYASSATGAAGNNFLSLKSTTAGEFKLGRLNTGTLSAWGTMSVFGTKLGGGYGSAGQYARYGATATTNWNTAPTRFNNAVEYTTPDMNGFKGRLLYVPMVDQGDASSAQLTASSATTLNGASSISSLNSTQAAGVNRAGAQDISIAYSQGPLNVMAAVQTIKVGANGINAFVGVGPALTANTTSTLTTLAANYKFGNTTAYGGTWTEKQDTATAVDITGNIFGVKYNMGAVDLMASMTSTKDNSGASTVVNRKVTGLGGNYNLSKNSYIYARYENRDANTTLADDVSTKGITKTTAVGLKVSF